MPTLRRDLFFFLFLGALVGAWFAFSFFSARTVMALVVGVIFGFLSFKRGKVLLLFYVISFTVAALLLFIRFPPESGEGSYLGLVIAVKNNYYVLWHRGVRYYVYEKATVREFGDVLLVSGKCRPYERTVYESRFDFGEYLKSRGITYAINVKTTEVKWRWPLRLRSYELLYLEKFSSKARVLIDALLFSHRDYSEPLIQEASSLGCLYFLSASGILLSSFLRLAEKLLTLKLSERKSQIISTSFGALFLLFNIGKVGLWRVVLTKALGLYLTKGDVRPPRIYVLSLTGLFLLAVNRYNALDTGFLMGYGLAFFMSLSGGLIGRYQGIRSKVVGRISLFGFLLPSLASAGGLHLLAFVYGLALLPFTLSYAAIAAFGFISLAPVTLLNGYAGFISEFVTFLSSIDLVIPLGGMSEIYVFLYYVFYLAAFFFSDCGLTHGRRLTLLTLALSAILNLVPLGNAFTQEVSFVNVGQGDCILVRDGYTSVLLDTGGNTGFDMAQEVDIPFLRKNRIYDLDCLIASHGDFDHIGAKDSLMKHFPVRRFVEGKGSFPLDVGPLHFENYNVYDLTSENEQSLVLRLSFMGRKWLFTGDAPLSVEDRILSDHPDFSCDILKVGHHGSKTSSSFNWLTSLKPEVGIISVGKNNPYGHPDEEVLTRLRRAGIAVRRTDEEGTITFRIFKGQSLAVIKKSLTSFLVPFSTEKETTMDEIRL